MTTNRHCLCHAQGKVQQQEYGKFVVTYTPQKAGPHSILIKIWNVDVCEYSEVRVMETPQVTLKGGAINVRIAKFDLNAAAAGCKKEDCYIIACT